MIVQHPYSSATRESIGGSKGFIGRLPGVKKGRASIAGTRIACVVTEIRSGGQAMWLIAEFRGIPLGSAPLRGS